MASAPLAKRDTPSPQMRQLAPANNNGGGKPARGSLMRRFAKAATKIVVTLVAAACLTYAGYLAVHFQDKGAPLTQAETALVVGVFGDEIDASKIRKYHRERSIAQRMAPKTVGGMVLPPLSYIDFYGAQNHSNDYAKDNAQLTDLFMHEITHVWQNQNMKWSLHHLDKVRRYEYTLTPQSRFDNFALEQKAEIIGHYARIWLHPRGKIQSGREASAEDILLRDVVEARFPRARETREALPPPAKPPAQPTAQPGAAKPKMPNS